MMWRPSESVEEDSASVGRASRRSRRRAWRDGLADQTVVLGVEGVRSYRAFERALVGSVDARSALELALAHRLASLLWRLRRACAIGTGLFEMQGELLSARERHSSRRSSQFGALQSKGHGSNGRDDPPASEREPLLTTIPAASGRWSKSRTIAERFLRLSNLDPTLLDRVCSYEARLWCQAAQTIWTLDAMRRPPPAPTRRPFRKPVVPSYWDAERLRVR